MREGITVPEKAVLHEQFEAVGTLRTGAPAERPLSGAAADHVEGLSHHLPFLLAGEVARDLMVIAVTGDLVAAADDGLDRVREPLGDRAAGEKSRLDLLFLEDPQDAPDRRVRPVLALGIFLVVARSVGQRPHVLAALEIEG